MKRERKDKQKGTKNKVIKTGNISPFGLIEKKVTKKTKILSLIVISILTFVSYFPTIDNEITSWDDEFYINKNPYLKDLSSENISNLFKIKTGKEKDDPIIYAENPYMGNYHPLSMVSLSIDYAIGGEDEDGNINPFMFHLTNLILHILISLLVFWFVKLLFKNFNIALIAALLFGVHTVHVESVAWISERKDVLYSFFFVASLILYIKYTDSKKLIFYILAFLMFLFSLFSKGQAVSLAVTIILIDWFKGRKLKNIVRLIIEKIPFFTAAIIFGLIAIAAQQESEALVDEQGYDFFQRIGIASFAFIQYNFKLILPVNLSAMYPYPDIINQTIPSYYYAMILPVLLIVVLSVGLFFKEKKTLFFGIGFFIVNIFLLLQFIPVGSAVYADRYAYIPSIGFFILFAVILVRFVKNKPEKKKIIFSLTGIYILVLSVLSFERNDIWQNSETLWIDTVEKSPKSVIAWNNLGSLKDRQAVAAFEEMRIEDAKELRKEAISYFSKAIEGKPDYRNAFYNRGVSNFELGKLNKDSTKLIASVKDFSDAISQDGQFADAYHNRANAKAELGILEAALKDYNLAIDIKSVQENKEDFNSYYSNRGIVKGKMGDYDGALEDFNIAIEINPFEAASFSNRGRAKMLKGDTNDAIKDFNVSIQLEENNYSAYLNRAVAKQILKDYDGALADYGKTIEINPRAVEAYFSRAKLFLIMNNATEGCKDLKEANRLGHPLAPVFLENYCK